MTFEPYPPASGTAIPNDHLFFDTVAEMKGTAPDDGDQCHTAGYYAVGDGGGSDGYTFHITGQSLETEDGGFIHFGAADSWFEANNKTVANALQFGAVGDGVTDDSVALQAMFSSTAKNIQFGSKSYVTDASLTSSLAGRVIDLGGGTLLQGDALATILLSVSGNGTTVRNGTIQGDGSGTTPIMLQFTGADDCTASHLTVKDSADMGIQFVTCERPKAEFITCSGNHGGASSSFSGNLQLSQCSFGQVSNVTITESLGKGVSFSGSDDCTVDGLSVERAVFATEATNCLYITEGSRNRASNIYGKNGNIKVSKNTFDTVLSDFSIETTGYRPLYLQGAVDCKIQNGFVDTSNAVDSGALVLHQHPTGPVDATDITITNVEFTQTGTGDSLVILDGNVARTKFIGCKFRSSAAITNYGNDDMVSDFGVLTEFINCDMEYTGSGIPDVYADRAGGVVLRNTRVVQNTAAATAAHIRTDSSIIEGGYYETNDLYAIRLVGATMVRGVEIVNANANVSGETGIRMDAGGAGSRIIDCTIDANTGTGIWMTAAGCEDIVVENCEIDGTRTVYIVQSTTNKVLGGNLTGIAGIDGVQSTGVNGTVTPGPHVHLSLVDAAISASVGATADTVADMQALTGLPDLAQVVTKGYNTLGDGGGSADGYTYHDAGQSGETEDGGFVIFGTVGDDYFTANNQKIANAQQFGAVGDNQPSSGAANSIAINAAIAAFVAANDVTPQGVTEVLIPPGDYYIDSTLVCDCTGNPNLVLRGSGRDITRIIASDAIGTTPLFQFTNTTTNGSQRCEFGTIEDISFTGTQPSAGQPDDVLDLPAMNHMVIKKVRTIGGGISGVKLGYCITTSFVDCLFQGSQKFGLRCTETVCNDLSFRGTGFLSNTICGFYAARSGFRNLNFFGCAFETNGSLGAYFMESLGLAMHGCYFEVNGATAPHTFLTRANAALLGGNWAVQGDVCLAGRTTTGLDDANLPTDTGEIGCRSVSMRGNAWSPNNANQRHVILAGVDNVDIQQPGDAEGTDQPWADFQGGRTLTKNVRLVGKQDQSGPHYTFDADSILTSGIPQGLVDGHRFSWASGKEIELELGRGVATGNSTWTPKMVFPGITAYSLSDTVAGPGDYNDLAQRIIHDEWIGEKCIISAFAYFMTSANASTYNCGLQLLVTDLGGSKQSSTSLQTLNPNDAVSTGTIAPAATALTIADATGMAGGDPIVVKGAGTGGIDHATVITTVSGGVAQLRDQAPVGGTDVEVRVPRLSHIRLLFEPAVGQTDGKSSFQLRRLGGAAFDEIWIDRVTVRELGSDENMEPYHDPKVLRSVGSPDTVVSGAPGYQCMRIDGGTNTTLYIKETGTGKSGWVAK